MKRWFSSNSKLFDKVLVANRGEIAVRVMESCKKLGIRTVAVYSEPDRHSVAVKMADEAVCIGPAASVDSYLSIPNIIKAVKDTGANAVHPGYGFLSENKLFCEALDKIGVKFIGPDPFAISAMGDKIESKQLAIDAGVNTIPGYQGIIQDEEEAVKVANEIRYPVMIKASAGGGGKGMRVAYDDEEAKIGYRLSKEEAASSFDDDRLFVEKFIEDPRHIEIQLIADQFGNVVPFPERECSIQRRNQKVIEEAPSMLLDDKTRIAMGEQAKMLAKAVKYQSAGTVEFLCDKHKNFYFLEMNTRLQVEHPVTEMISKVDLVEQMLRIAAGRPIPDELLQGPLKIHGWSMESRVYAEDPLRGFLPSIGRLRSYVEPTKYPGVRVDSGVVEGSDISMFYDPMISKLITHGKDRNECIQRMKVALNNYVVRGPGHNINFMMDIYRHPRFESGKLTTKFIDEEYPDGFKGVELSMSEKSDLTAMACTMQALNEISRNTISGQMESQRIFVPSKKLNHLKKIQDKSLVIPTYQVYGDGIDAATVAQTLLQDDDAGMNFKTYYISIDGSFGKPTLCRIAMLQHKLNDMQALVVLDKDSITVLSDIHWPSRGNQYQATVGNTTESVQILSGLPEGLKLQHHGAIHDVVIRTEQEMLYGQHMSPKPEIDTSKMLLCPMPGMLVSVSVQEGDTVQPGQELAVVEAMKMQNILRAEKQGTISKVNASSGESLKVDQVIIEFE